MLVSKSTFNIITALFITIAVVILLQSCNNKYLTINPIPDKSQSINEELNYLINTDQLDRKSNILRFLLFKNSKHIINVALRDSLRCNYLLKKLMLNPVLTNDDKFNCGLILMHGDGKVDCRDTNIYRLSMDFFYQIKVTPNNRGDSLNAQVWFPLAQDRYYYLLNSCSSKSENINNN